MTVLSWLGLAAIVLLLVFVALCGFVLRWGNRQLTFDGATTRKVEARAFQDAIRAARKAIERNAPGKRVMRADWAATDTTGILVVAFGEAAEDLARWFEARRLAAEGPT